MDASVMIEALGGTCVRVARSDWNSELVQVS